MCAGQGLVYDPRAGVPGYGIELDSRPHDIVPPRPMRSIAGATSCSIGLFDYAWWHGSIKRTAALSALQSNTKLLKAKDMPLVPGSDVLSDRIGFLPGRLASSRRNPMQVAVREVW